MVNSKKTTKPLTIWEWVEVAIVNRCSCEVGDVFCVYCHFVLEQFAKGERCVVNSLHSNEVAVAISFDAWVTVCCFRDAQCNAIPFLVVCHFVSCVVRSVV